MTDLSIACLLYNAERTRAGDLSFFFEQLKEIERKSECSTERIVWVDNKTTDNTAEIARDYCEPESFDFNGFADAKNRLLERAKGGWVFIPEPDMRYDTDAVADIIKGAKGKDFKCIEAWQKIKHYRGGEEDNLYTTLMKPSARFYGEAFVIPKVFPHEECAIDCFVGTHHMEAFSKRVEQRRPLVKKELEELALVKDDPEENYWAAKRYFEIASAGFISGNEASDRICSLLTDAIRLDPSFGPAYYELAAHYLLCQGYPQALRIASQGIEKGYEPCKSVMNSILRSMQSEGGAGIRIL